MFAGRYFAASYFAPRYWPQFGAGATIIIERDIVSTTSTFRRGYALSAMFSRTPTLTAKVSRTITLTVER